MAEPWPVKRFQVVAVEPSREDGFPIFGALMDGIHDYGPDSIDIAMLSGELNEIWTQVDREPGAASEFENVFAFAARYI